MATAQANGTTAGMAKAAAVVRKPYFLVFVLLAVITVFEVQVPTLGASIGLDKVKQIIVLMSTAVAKASLVALYYMHLKYEPLVLRYVPLVPLFLVLILVLTLTR